MKRIFVICAIVLLPSVLLAARVYSRRERVELNASRATAFNNALTGQLPACTNWRHGSFAKECTGNGQLLPSGSCSSGSVVTVLYPDCRYTPANLTDVPDGIQLETE